MPAKEKREIESVLKKKGWNNDVPRTAQQTIPFERMFPNGICRVRDDYYTKTIAFQDINYQQADKEDQKQIFEGWCGFNNYFDSSVHIEYNFVNQCTDIEGFEKQLNFSTRRDRPEQMKRELTQILKNQFEQGNNGITKTRYITFGIHAENVKQAKPRLTHLQNDIISNFKQIGVEST